jgi:hypothetical protein
MAYHKTAAPERLGRLASSLSATAARASAPSDRIVMPGKMSGRKRATAKSSPVRYTLPVPLPATRIFPFGWRATAAASAVSAEAPVEAPVRQEADEGEGRRNTSATYLQDLAG